MSSMTLVFYTQALSTMSYLTLLACGYPAPLKACDSLLELTCYVGVILGGAPVQIFITRAIQIGPPTKVATLFTANLLFSSAMTMALLSGESLWTSGIGCIVIMASILLVTRQQGKKTEQLYQAVATAEELEEGRKPSSPSQI